MQNPWKTIELSDYENHMKLDSVMQLPALNDMMKQQFCLYPVKTVMVLGVAGGNGLEHVEAEKFQKVYGVDVNQNYLKECKRRYRYLKGVLECICTDLTDETAALPHADMIIANLLIEYIGYQCFRNIIAQVNPSYVSCIIQINTDEHFVSDSPYLHVFEHLDKIHHQMQEEELTAVMKETGYHLTARKEQPLPNEKKLVQMDFMSKK